MQTERPFRVRLPTQSNTEISIPIIGKSMPIDVTSTLESHVVWKFGGFDTFTLLWLLWMNNAFMAINLDAYGKPSQPGAGMINILRGINMAMYVWRNENAVIQMMNFAFRVFNGELTIPDLESFWDGKDEDFLGFTAVGFPWRQLVKLNYFCIVDGLTDMSEIKDFGRKEDAHLVQGFFSSLTPKPVLRDNWSTIYKDLNAKTFGVKYLMIYGKAYSDGIKDELAYFSFYTGSRRNLPHGLVTFGKDSILRSLGERDKYGPMLPFASARKNWKVENDKVMKLYMIKHPTMDVERLEAYIKFRKTDTKMPIFHVNGSFGTRVKLEDKLYPFFTLFAPEYKEDYRWAKFNQPQLSLEDILASDPSPTMSGGYARIYQRGLQELADGELESLDDLQVLRGDANERMMAQMPFADAMIRVEPAMDEGDVIQQFMNADDNMVNPFGEEFIEPFDPLLADPIPQDVGMQANATMSFEDDELDADEGRDGVQDLQPRAFSERPDRQILRRPPSDYNSQMLNNSATNGSRLGASMAGNLAGNLFASQGARRFVNAGAQSRFDQSMRVNQMDAEDVEGRRQQNFELGQKRLETFVTNELKNSSSILSRFVDRLNHLSDDGVQSVFTGIFGTRMTPAGETIPVTVDAPALIDQFGALGMTPERIKSQLDRHMPYIQAYVNDMNNASTLQAPFVSAYGQAEIRGQKGYYGLNNPLFGTAPIADRVPTGTANLHLANTFRGIKETEPPIKTTDQFADVVQNAFETVNDTLYRKKEEFLKYKSNLMYQAFQQAESSIKAGRIVTSSASYSLSQTKCILPLWNIEGLGTCCYPISVQLTFQEPYVLPPGAKAITLYGAIGDRTAANAVPAASTALDHQSLRTFLTAAGTSSLRLLSFSKKPEKLYKIQVAPYFGYADTLFSPLRGTVTSTNQTQIANSVLLTPAGDLLGPDGKIPVSVTTTYEHQQAATRNQSPLLRLNTAEVGVANVDSFITICKSAKFAWVTNVRELKPYTSLVTATATGLTAGAVHFGTQPAANAQPVANAQQVANPLQAMTAQQVSERFFGVFENQANAPISSLLTWASPDVIKATTVVQKLGDADPTNRYVYYRDDFQPPLLITADQLTDMGFQNPSQEVLSAFYRMRNRIYSVLMTALKAMNELTYRYLYDYHKQAAVVPGADPEELTNIVAPRPQNVEYKWEKNQPFSWPQRLSQMITRLGTHLTESHQASRMFGNFTRLAFIIAYLRATIDLVNVTVDISAVPRYLKLFWGRDKQIVNSAKDIKDVLVMSSYQTLVRLGINPSFKLANAIASSTRTIGLFQYLEIPFSERSFKLMAAQQLEMLRTQLFNRRQALINDGGADPEDLNNIADYPNTIEAGDQHRDARDRRKAFMDQYFETRTRLVNSESPVCPVTVTLQSFRDIDSYLRYLILMHWQRVFGYSKKMEQEKIAKDRVLRFLNRDTVQINKLVTTFGGKPMNGKFIETNK